MYKTSGFTQNVWILIHEVRFLFLFTNRNCDMCFALNQPGAANYADGSGTMRFTNNANHANRRVIVR